MRGVGLAYVSAVSSNPGTSLRGEHVVLLCKFGRRVPVLQDFLPRVTNEIGLPDTAGLRIACNLKKQRENVREKSSGNSYCSYRTCDVQRFFYRSASSCTLNIMYSFCLSINKTILLNEMTVE